MSKANRKTSTAPTLRPFERVPFTDGMSTGLRSLFGDWQAEVISYRELYRQRETEGATNKRLDAMSERSRRVQDKIQRKIFSYPLRTAPDALAIARFAEMLKKGGDFATPAVALRRVLRFIEGIMPSPPATASGIPVGSTLAPLYSQLEQSRVSADAMSAAGNDDAAEGHDQTRDKIVDLIADARATTKADMIIKLRVLRWSTSLLADGSGVEGTAELRMIDGLIADIEGRGAPSMPTSDPVIALLAEWTAAEAEIERTRGEDNSDDTDEHKAAWDHRFAVEARIKTTPASSHAGMLGKLRLAASYVDGGGEEIWESAHRDAETLIGPHSAGGVADQRTAAGASDDQLIALCAKWQAGTADEVAAFDACDNLTGAAYDKAHAAADAIQTRNNAMLYRISVKQARTVQGFIAQLRTVGQFHREMEGDGSGPTGGPRSVQAMLHRVMGQAERFAVPAVAAEPAAETPAIAAE